MKNKLSVGQWYDMIRNTRDEAGQNIEVLTVGDESATTDFLRLVGPAAETFFRTDVLTANRAYLNDIDLMVAFIGQKSPDEELAVVVKNAKKAGIEILAFVDESLLDQDTKKLKQVEAELTLDLSPGKISYFSADMDGRRRQALLKKIIAVLGNKSLALAARVPVFRPLVVERIINEISGENGLIGAVAFIPAGDMPVLTANQIRMIFKLAAAHGLNLNFERAKELLIVVGGGFTFRSIARQLMGLVPLAGWAVKGGVAYTGTQTIGRLAAKYFSALTEEIPGCQK